MKSRFRRVPVRKNETEPSSKAPFFSKEPERPFFPKAGSVIQPKIGVTSVKQQGRVNPTRKAQGLPLNDNAQLEKEADTMGAKASQAKPSTTMRPPLSASTGQKGIVQRRIQSQVSGQYAFGGKPARFESSSNKGEKTGQKPLLVIPTTTNNRHLHVHLIPVKPPARMTGWTIKDVSTGKYPIQVDKDVNQAIDAEDQGLFNTHAAGWNDWNKYPGDIKWSNPPKAEIAAAQASEQAKREAEKKANYIQFLEEKKDGYVKRMMRDKPITLTITATTRARKTKGKKETASQYQEKIKAAKPLPEVEGVSGKFNVSNDGKVTATFSFKGMQSFEAHAKTIIAKMKEAPESGLTWNYGADKDDTDATKQVLLQDAEDYLAAVRAGNHDDKIRKWASGKKIDVNFE